MRYDQDDNNEFQYGIDSLLYSFHIKSAQKVVVHLEETGYFGQADELGVVEVEGASG